MQILICMFHDKEKIEKPFDLLEKLVKFFLMKEMIPENFRFLIPMLRKLKYRSITAIFTLTLNFMLQLKSINLKLSQIDKSYFSNYSINFKEIILDEIENIDEDYYLELINIF